MPGLRRLCVSAAFVSVLFAASPAQAQAIDEGFRADIDKLLEVTHAAEIATQLMSVVNRQLMDAEAKAHPEVPQRVLDLVRQTIDDEFGKAFRGPEGMLAQIADVYAKHFTQKDIRGLVAFYSSDLGRKAIATMPAVMQDSAAVGQKWAEAHMPAIIEAMQEKLRAEGFGDSPAPNAGHVF